MPSATSRRGGAANASPGANASASPNPLNGDAHSARGESPLTSENNANNTKSDLSSAASTLRAAQTAASIEDAAPENLKQVFKALDKRRRNMEKRSERLAEYKAKLAQGENLNKDQREAASHYEEVLGAISFAKELTESLHKLAVDVTREEKQQAKAAAAEKKVNDLQRLQLSIVFNHALQTISNPLCHELLLSGSEGAPHLSSDELTALLGVADSVRAGRRHRLSEDEDAVSLTPEEAAENLAALLDASAYKRITTTHSYADVNGFLQKVVESNFCHTVDLTPKQEEPAMSSSESEGEAEVESEESPMATEESTDDSSQNEFSSSDVVTSTVEEQRVETSPEKRTTPPGFESTPPPLIRQEIEVHQQMEVTSTSDQEQKLAAAVSMEGPATSIETSSSPSQPTTEATDVVAPSPKDEGNCYSFTVPPPRPFHQVIQSVQGSFDFLQDSLLDSQAEQASKSSSAAAAPTPAESSPVGSGAVTGIIGGASLGSQQMATSSLLGTSDSACDETMPSSLSFHDASPMVDDPAVMHVTGGPSNSLIGSTLMSANSLTPSKHGAIGTPERISHSTAESSSHLHRSPFTPSSSSPPKNPNVHRALDTATLDAAGARSRQAPHPQHQEQQQRTPTNDAYQIHSKANISDSSIGALSSSSSGVAATSAAATASSFTLTGISPASHSNLPNSAGQNLLNNAAAKQQVSKRSNAIGDTTHPQSGVVGDPASSSTASSRANEGFGVVGSGVRVKTGAPSASTSLGLSVGGDASATDGLSFGGESINFGLQQVSSSLMETNGYGGSMDPGKWPDSSLKNALANSFINEPSPLDDPSLRNIQDMTVGAFPVTSQHQTQQQQQQSQPLSTAALSKDDLPSSMGDMYMDDRNGRGGNRSNYPRHTQPHNDYNHQSKDQHSGYASHRQSGYGGGRQNSTSPSVGMSNNGNISGGIPKTGNGGGNAGGNGGGRWAGGNGGGGGYGGRSGGGGGGFRGGATVRGGYGGGGNNRAHGGHMGGGGGGGGSSQMRGNRGMPAIGRNMAYPQ